MEANVTTQTVEKVVLETEEVITVKMTRREAEVMRSVLYLAEFDWSGAADDPQLKNVDDLCNIRYSLGSTLGWGNTMFVVDTNLPPRRETVYIKLR